MVIPRNLAIGYRKGKPVATASNEIRLPTTGLTFLVGANGEGKTTLMRYLGGLLKHHPLPKGADRGLYLPDEMLFPPTLPMRVISRAMFGKSSPEHHAALALAIDLNLDIHKPYKELSQGNRQKVKLIIGISEASRDRVSLLCMDEPLSGLDYKVRRSLWMRLREVRAERQLVVSVHNDRFIEKPNMVIAVRKGEITEHPGVETWEEIEEILDGSVTPDPLI